MLGGGSVLSIFELHGEGKGIKEISRELGFSRNTVRKYLRAREVPERKPAPRRPSILDPYKEKVLELINKGVWNCVVIKREIEKLGYSGGITILKDFVQPFRVRRQPEAVMRYETKPGEQAQADWGQVNYIENGRKKKLYFLALTLSYSREMYVEFTTRSDTKSLIKCLVHGFEHFGGIPEKVLFDRMKAVVLDVDSQKNPIWNPRFLDFALTFGFIPVLCRAYRAQTKGKVESGVKYVKRNFWPERRFRDLFDLNNQALTWCAEVGRRIHGTTNERPVDRFKDEKLNPLPRPETLIRYLSETRKVSTDGFVSFNRSFYGVPWELARKEVDVVDLGLSVEVRYQDKRVALFEKARAPGTRQSVEGQYEGLAFSAPIPKREPLGIRVTEPVVETRPLSVYEAVAGGDDR
ncbi:MAG: IS21 family transposase [Bacillota bacterium]|jgi:transposase